MCHKLQREAPLAHKSPVATWEPQVSWGIDLATEHERFLSEEVFKQPVIVYNYPKEIKVRHGGMATFECAPW